MLDSLIARKLASLAYPNSLWKKPEAGNEIYLTFDDGPEPLVTPLILDGLRQYGAKATFFCLGKNVQAHPGIFQRIQHEGHGTGNHTFRHLNGWKTATNTYLDDVALCAEWVKSPLFRPPYGRLTLSQAKKINRLGYEIVMWSLLSKDYQQSLCPKQVLNYCLPRIKAGAILVFHDSLKAAPRLVPVLSPLLQAIEKKKLICAPLPGSCSLKH